MALALQRAVPWLLDKQAELYQVAELSPEGLPKRQP
jgi:hypothetical protein